MSKVLTFLDQTLQQGLKKQLPRQKILLMVDLLQRVGIETMDVVWQDVRDYELPIGICNRIRVIIPPDISVLSEVVEGGFKKIIVAYEYQSVPKTLAELHCFFEVVRHVGIRCTLRLENAARLPLPEIQALLRNLHGEVLDSFIYEDTGSLLESQTANDILSNLCAISPFPLEFHGSDGAGLAAANTLSAIRAGIDRVGTAICGVGHSAYTPFEQVVMAAKHILCLREVFVDPNLARDCAAILACLGEMPRLDQPVVGDNIFAHESGLHVYGVMKNSRVYEPFAPEEVGLQRRLILGRQSGTSFLEFLLQRLGLQMTDGEMHQLLKKIHQMVIRQKRPVNYQEFLQLCHKEVM